MGSKTSAAMMIAAGQSPSSCCRQSGVHHFAGKCDRTKVDGNQRAGGQGVGHAAFEDQVDIHQPVANDGVAERQRKKDLAQHANLAQQRRRRRRASR